MNISNPHNMTYAGQPARLFVLRNNGYCWGRLILPSGENLDINVRRDLYGLDDSAAFKVFKRAARHGQTSPAVGWILSYPGSPE